MYKWLLILLITLIGLPAMAEQAQAAENNSGQVKVDSARNAVDFELQGIDGKTYRLSDYRGKWVLVNYWATWCPPCLEELPELEIFHNNHKDTDAVVLGVNSENISQEELKKFTDDQFLSFPILLSKPSASSPLGPLPGLPTSYMVSPEGVVVAQQIGGITAAALEAYIERKTKK